MVVGLFQRVVLVDDRPGQGVDVIRDAIGVDQELVRPGPVRRIAMLVLPEEAQGAAAQPDADAGIQVHRGAVVGIPLRHVLAGVRPQERGEPALLHHDVDHTRDGVRPVLRRGAVTQHLDAVDGAAGDGVEIHAA